MSLRGPTAFCRARLRSQSARRSAGRSAGAQHQRERQVAEDQVATYQKQRVAAQGEKELREAQARAHQQTAITESELSITVQENQGKAAVKRERCRNRHAG